MDFEFFYSIVGNYYRSDHCSKKQVVSPLLKFNVDNPVWENRDRLVLSAGHASMLLYAAAYLVGYKDIDIDDILKYLSVIIWETLFIALLAQW